MTGAYDRIAGHGIERLAALSDGIFAVAMTLLVLDLRLPAQEAIHGERELWRALEALSPQIVMYMMSFMTLGIFWVGQQTQLNHLSRTNRSLAWIHLVFLFAVTIVPFSTKLLAEFPAYHPALLTYWLNLLLLGITLYFSWVCAEESGVVKEELSDDVARAIKRRILIGQWLYALGALLSIVSTYVSIALLSVCS